MFFSSIEFACAERQPGPCVRALCEAVAQMLSKNMTCARPRRNATPSKHFPHTSHCTLHTSHLHFTLARRTRHFISSQIMWALLTSPHLSSSHLIPSLLTFHLSKFFSTVFIPSEHWSTFLVSLKFVSTHLSCSARQSSYCQRQVPCTKKTFGAESFCTQTLETQMHLHTKAFRKYFVLKACTKHIPVLLCTTKLAQSTSQYYFVLQSLHKALRSTTLYYKACTKHFAVLLCTTKLAKSTSQYYSVLQSLHKALPSTTF